MAGPVRAIVAGLLGILAFGGCAEQRHVAGERQESDVVAATISKAAILIFHTDFADFGVPVGEVFSEAELEVLRTHLRHVVPLIEVALGWQDSVWGANFAGYFRIKEVLPLLRSHFFAPRRCYGWEGPDYFNSESYLTDEQYPYSLAYLEAIQQITGRSIDEAVPPDASESAVIAKYAGMEKSEFHHWALWMKRKLKIEDGPGHPVKAARP